MTVSLHNRRKLEEAIHRLIDGTATQPDGKLTWKNVAMVAGVSKATADRAIDLRDEFRRQLKTRMPPPASNPVSSSRSRSDVDEELALLRRQCVEFKESTKVLHSVIVALVQENNRLARRRRDDAEVVALIATDNAPQGER